MVAKTSMIAATMLLLLTPMTLPIVATLPLLLKICSKRWSHCPETIVSKGTGTLSVAEGQRPNADSRM
ncbi:MAG: hypothetical protein IIX55_05275 [Muribaculaceae bacterium]|nr:hypothetical protein [Muribaculaceae bacterium]